MIKPNPISIDPIIVLPYDSKGRGTPTTGSIPITIAILINTCAKNKVAIPTVTNVANFDLQCIATDKQLAVSIA